GSKLAGMAHTKTDKPRRGRPPFSDAQLATVAQFYELGLRRGEPPVLFVARQLSGRNEPRPAYLVRVRNWVHMARKRGLLSQTKGGVAKGQLSQKAKRLLGIDTKR